jgi:hypothetical protein
MAIVLEKFFHGYHVMDDFPMFAKEIIVNIDDFFGYGISVDDFFSIAIFI